LQQLQVMISHKNHPNSKKSKNLHLTCFASFTLVGGSGFFQSFLLIRELILERFPQPVNAPEPMEPIEPTEGGEDLQGGWSLGRRTSFLWDWKSTL